MAEGARGPRSSSEGLLSFRLEGSALPGEDSERVPAEAVSSPSVCSRADQQDTCKSTYGDAEALQCLKGRVRGGRLYMEYLTISPSLPSVYGAFLL